ncbi:MAG: ABC transporter ATP-binding protein [Spirochaetales bacterium]|nr:ABC transporter ATP-binding protein [Spirochaetales bacterium]
MITVRGLTKRYGNGKGIEEVTFTIDAGEVFGYLGPNGAGKTTTIRHLLGFLSPDSGWCTIDGLDCWNEADEIQKRLGYIPGEVAFMEDMTGIAFLRLLADMRNMDDRGRMDELIARFALDPSGRIRTMSKGMKQKLAVVASCMHDPAVVIFDEPTSGLDPLMQRLFVEFVAEERRRRKTILMSSHSFDEVERTCDRVGIIRDGRLAAIHDIGALASQRQRIFAVTLRSADEVERIVNAGYTVGAIDGRRVEVHVQGSPDPFIKVLAGVTVESLDAQHMTLEEVFMQYYGEEATP